jgi:putative FmdB family regulatory protein|tara:strand:- start:141 stop:428 length:288 start_codon:yes stop_codon:yes gene_type:complete
VPIYEYYCPGCGNEIELLQKMGEDAPTCTECVKEVKDGEKVISILNREMKRKFSKSTVIFKGKGFYETDYKKKKTEPKEEKSVPTSESSNGDSES